MNKLFFWSICSDALCISVQVTVISSLSMSKVDIRVIFAILSTLIGYCAKTYLSLSVLLDFFSFWMDTDTSSVYMLQMV